MKHAFIAPINYLHLIPESADYHLMLAHLIDDTPMGKKYIDFYKRRAIRGDFIILDNSAFEFKKPMEADEYKRRIDLLGFMPNIIVAPDYPFEDWKKTVRSAEEFASTYTEHLDASVQLMGVPQSIKGDHKGWMECHAELCNIPHVKYIGMSILGVPNAFCSVTGTKDISFNRNYLSVKMMRSGTCDLHKRYHFLGCSDPRELLMMKAIGLAHGNDSSTAFWHGIQLIKFDDTYSGLVNGKSPIEVDFYKGKSSHLKYEDDVIAYNIVWIEQMLAG